MVGCHGRSMPPLLIGNPLNVTARCGLNKFCPPGRPDPGQIQDIIVFYARNHLDIRHLPAAVVALMAMWDAFPCQQ